ncbi:MAG: hypothetical protein AABX54_05220 [Nanoarchaeota archaeon]
MKKSINKVIKKEKKLVKREFYNITFNLIFAFLTLFIPIIFKKYIILATILLSLISIIALFKWKSAITFLIFLFGALWGPLSEMIAIYFNVWNYSYANFINIPIWLFIVWGNAAAFLYQTGLEIKKLGVKK